MLKIFNKISLKDWEVFASNVLNHLIKWWYVLALAFLIGGGLGYWYIYRSKPTYTATISFVLSTESKQMGGLASLVTQLGYDAGTNGTENIFSGDNIIELFRSRKIISKALFSRIDSGQRLIDYIVHKQYPANRSLTPFPDTKEAFSESQKGLFNLIVSEVINSLNVFKKEKLVFYYISATSADEKVAYYIAKHTLDQTSTYFIETRTRGASSSLQLLQKETDSLSRVISQLYRTTAAVNDQTYNINPAFMSQRSVAFFNQTKVAAMGAAYTEAMRNLEIAKINLQKEIPLYRIIDESELPLPPEKKSAMKYSLAFGMLLLIITAILLSIPKLKSSYTEITHANT